jgi:hypothetical protein
MLDAPVRNSIPAQRPCDASCGMLGIPRLKPRPGAFLKFANDLIHDVLIHICFRCLFFPWLTGSREPD